MLVVLELILFQVLNTDQQFSNVRKSKICGYIILHYYQPVKLHQTQTFFCELLAWTPLHYENKRCEKASNKIVYEI